MIEKSTTELEQFRYTLYQTIDNRADTLMDLVDALCSSVTDSRFGHVMRDQRF